MLNYFEKEGKDGLYIENSSYISATINLILGIFLNSLGLGLPWLFNKDWIYIILGFTLFMFGWMLLFLSKLEFRNAARMYRYLKILVSK